MLQRSSSGVAARVQYSTWLLVSDALASGAVATSVNLAAGYLQQVCLSSHYDSTPSSTLLLSSTTVLLGGFKFIMNRHLAP